MLLEVLSAAGDLGRLHEIAAVLARHGFGDLLQRTGLARLLKRAGRALSFQLDDALPAMSLPERGRRVLEELGPTFVKLGQVLATRPDLLPEDWLQELGELQGNVASLPWEAIEAQLVEDLGAPPDEVFAQFDRKPLAAASIAQVHRAVTRRGEEVVLKVRRPGIDETIEKDLRLLARLAELLDEEEPELRRYRPKLLVKEFARTVRAELDMRTEARNLAAMARNVAEHRELALPRVLDDFTRARLLVMTRLDGIPATAWLRGERLPGSTIEPREVARVGADVVLDMVLVHGFYHADPHPGNVFFLRDGRVGLIDFGMVGRLTEERRFELVTLLACVLRRDTEPLVDVLLDWGGEARRDIEPLRRDTAAFIDRWSGRSLDEVDVSAMLLDVAALVRENDLVLPADVSLLIKALVTLEGLGRALDPEFDLSAALQPKADELRRTIYSPRALARRSLREFRSLLRGLPSDLRQLVLRLRRQGFRVQLDLERLDTFGASIERSVNRVTVGIVTAALIVGTAIAMNVSAGPRFFGLPALSTLGFLTSTALGAGLLFSILRSNRKR